MKKKSVRKDTNHILRRAQHFPIILIAEGLLTGAVGGLIVLLYRLALKYAEQGLGKAVEMAGKTPLHMAGWFAVLLVLAVLTGRLIKWEPMISGSGIPQVEGEIQGKLTQNWKKVLPAKFTGGFLCLLGGLSLGREGPSIQLGAMAGKGISDILDRGRTEEKYLMTCGASAGLSAAFHAPLAGMMFALEEVHKGFTVSILLSVMTASVTADYMVSHIIGLEPVFTFQLEHVLPQNYYWLLLLLGVILGAAGAFYNWGMLKVQELYKKAIYLTATGKLMIAFLSAGILAVIMPSVLGSGHGLIEDLTAGKILLGTAVLTLVIKFLFSAVSFGSGAPGGIFFPLLILGAFIGGIFAMAAESFLGLDAGYMNNFVLLAMAGFFTAVVRAPITGIILLFEMSGSVNQMLSLAIVSVSAYIVATLLKSPPIYDSLLERILEGPDQVHERDKKVNQQKVLSDFVIMSGSCVEKRMVREVEWPDNCLLVALLRDGKERIPRGKTILLAGDKITVMTDERSAGYVHDKMEKLCYTSF